MKLDYVIIIPHLVGVYIMKYTSHTFAIGFCDLRWERGCLLMTSKPYFDENASCWDAMRTQFFSGAVREKAYDAAQVEAGRTAADVGAGSGFITEGLLKRGLRVIAVDQSEKMLKEIKGRFSEYNQLDLRVGDASQLPIHDEEVDYSFANMYLHHVDDPALAIKEMTRILKPGGKLIITDMDQHEFEFLRTEHFDCWMGFKREDVGSWLMEAGLKNVSVSSAGET